MGELQGAYNRGLQKTSKTSNAFVTARTAHPTDLSHNVNYVKFVGLHD